MNREDIIKIYDTGPNAVVELVQSLFIIIEQQATHIAELESRVQSLENQDVTLSKEDIRSTEIS